MNTTTAAPATARQLADILHAHDMIAHSDANARGAKFDGWVRYSHIAEYVDIAQADITAIITDCADRMTSPTHKITQLRPTAFMAHLVS
ncbi:hypothetical protein [Rhodococcus sp. 1168]|uniref:hypothetical protein n=1 Tax=Rhodococcus sp. 1168 TaxID=2018041 RepID=UPI000A0B727E|nr:hypothetical protein [Rhodococcus sp. 1168]ORI13413.1 hypothetical protein BJI47_22475 [Rhodococcus sp. 1168]